MILDKILKININSKLEEKIDFKKYNDENYFNFKTRNYCPYCKNENTFKHSNIWASIEIPRVGSIYDLKDLIFKHFKENDKDIFLFYNAKCSFNKEHLIYYVFKINNKGEIFKFGQYPFKSIKRKIIKLSWKLLRKLKLDIFMYNAYISSENNLHIGSFLYIRRVLEGLVKKISLDNEIDISNKKMLGEKVELIKDYLPTFIKENIKTFSQILGDTIHNLTEQEASKNYQFIVKVIDVFIHEIEAKMKSEKDKKEIRSALQEYEKS